MANALYICYFGIREPLVQTQVLPYLRELVKMEGLRMFLVTFEPKAAVSELQSYGVAKLRMELAEQGIDWHWLRYHKWPSVPATALDVLRGTIFVWRFIGRNDIDLLHSRVHLPMLMAAAARKFSRRKPKILFDIRGFFPEEYVDAGIWPEGGWLFRTAKRIERWLIKEADGFVVLTEKAREILFPDTTEGRDSAGRPVEVIPCCVEVAAFLTNIATRANVRRSIGADGRHVIVYTGSFGGWYLSDETYRLFSAAREVEPTVFIMVLTQRDARRVRDKLRGLGFEDNDLFVSSVAPTEIPRYLSAADLAVSFIKPCYSKQASSPTKNAEYLAAGLPMIANFGVGDVDELIETESVGVLIDRFDHDRYQAAILSVRSLGDIGERCREVARRRFDLPAIGGERYRRVYKRMTEESER